MKKYFVTFYCSFFHKEFGDVSLQFEAYLESDAVKDSPVMEEEVKSVFANTITGITKVERLYFVHAHISSVDGSTPRAFTVQ